MKQCASFSTRLVRVLGTATAATRESSGRDGKKAMAPTKPSSNSSAASKFWTKSARNAPRPAPRKPKKPRRLWKRPRLPSKQMLLPLQNRKQRKKKNNWTTILTWRGHSARAFLFLRITFSLRTALDGLGLPRVIGVSSPWNAYIRQLDHARIQPFSQACQ